MYDRFYGLDAEPFRLSPDHSFAYKHKGYKRARAYMAYAYLRAEGFVMVTGRPGTGKTTLVGALIDHLADENVSTANLVCTQLQADDLLKMVAYEFGIETAGIDKGELLQQLTRRLKAWHREQRRALLIVDEAQDLSVSAMEELRLLTNIQVDGKPLLQIFLLGQPELRELILSPKLEQVHQRIVAASHLEPLQREETEAYIIHRLRSVGWRGDPAISRPVYPLIYKFSEGIPRRINLICSRLFLHCAVEQRHEVRVRDVREVVAELQGESLAVGGGRLTGRDFAAADVFDEPPPVRDEDPVAAESERDSDADAGQPFRVSNPDSDSESASSDMTVGTVRHVGDVLEKEAVPVERGRVVMLPQAQTAQMRTQPARLRAMSASAGGAAMMEQWPDDDGGDTRASIADGTVADKETGPVRAGLISGDHARESSTSSSATEREAVNGEARSRRDLSVLIMVGFAVVSVLIVVWAAGGFALDAFGR
ncbi:MAG: AAA family ATPase [Halieaceae bacterium]|jgi:putative secretion ATPase (PEP-CTERM system associated)|nr:AAA family ATPase [Halieaceae bacterium]